MGDESRFLSKSKICDLGTTYLGNFPALCEGMEFLEADGGQR